MRTSLIILATVLGLGATSAFAQSTVVIAPAAPPAIREEIIPAAPSTDVVSAARPLVVERHAVCLGQRRLHCTAAAAGRLGSGSLGSVRDRLDLGRRLLAVT